MHPTLLVLLTGYGILLGIIGLIVVCRKRIERDPDDMTEDERLLASLVENVFRRQLIDYTRTMRMTKDLQHRIAGDKDLLEAVSYFMMTKVAHAEDAKRKRVEDERALSSRQLSSVEKRIIERLKR